MPESRAPPVPTFTSTTSLYFTTTYKHHQPQRPNQVSRLDRHPPPDTTEATCARTYLIIPRPKLHCSSIHSNSYDAGSYCNTARGHCNCRGAFLLLRLHNTAYVGYQTFFFEGESDPTRKSKTRNREKKKAVSFLKLPLTCYIQLFSWTKKESSLSHRLQRHTCTWAYTGLSLT